MKTGTALAITALAAAVSWTPMTPAQTYGADAGGVPPQLQTDTQRRAAKAQQQMQGAMQAQQDGQWSNGGGYADSAPAPAAYGVDGRAVATGLGAAMAVDVVNAAAGAATNAILRSDGQPYPQYAPRREDEDRDEAGGGPARPVEGQVPRYP